MGAKKVAAAEYVPAVVAASTSTSPSSCESLPDEEQLARLERRREPIILVQLQGLPDRHFRHCLLRLKHANITGFRFMRAEVEGGWRERGEG